MTEDDKNWIFYKCRNCGERHPQGEKPCEEEAE